MTTPTPVTQISMSEHVSHWFPLADLPGSSGEVIRLETLPVSDGSVTRPSNAFSTLSHFHAIATICVDSILGWRAVIGATPLTEAIEAKQLLEGLSNQLFKVSLRIPASSSIPFSTVLLRIYGEHMASFYDRNYELQVFQMLSRMGIGPKLIANGPTWRLEEFHESRVLTTQMLPNPSVFCQVASQLGRLHKIHRRPEFPEHFDRTPITLDRVEKWTREAQEAVPRLSIEDSVRAAKMMEQMEPEAAGLAALVHEQSAAGDRLGWNIVFCHNDVQENNILVTPYGIRLIDFEYANFNFQMADVGNFFNEFTMDYVNSVWSPENYPSLEARRLFATVYLSEYLERPVMDTESLDAFLEAAEIGSQLSHLLWGMWSLVRAQQHADTFGAFNFVGYAKFRFDSYLAKKARLGW